MELKPALKVDDPDNVATIFANGIVDGTEVEVRDKKGNSEIIRVHGDVPYGHKIALKDLVKVSALAVSWASSWRRAAPQSVWLCPS
jgi:altronate dehydratase small subunit